MSYSGGRVRRPWVEGADGVTAERNKHIIYTRRAERGAEGIERAEAKCVPVKSS